MVGVAITTKGASRLVIYEGNVDAPKFIDTIDEPIADILLLFKNEKWEWVMDNASIHTAKITQAHMVGRVPKLFPSKKWPANSPDVSAI